MAYLQRRTLHYHYPRKDSQECVSTNQTPSKVKSERAKNWIVNMANERKGKDYIMSLFMESLYLHRKYWRHLKASDLSKERTFSHLRCMEVARQSNDYRSSSSSVEYRRVKMEDDLCQLSGPITHESVLKILKQRYFDRKYHTFMGTMLVVINPQTHRLPHKALTCSRGLSDDLRLLMSNTLADVEERKQSHTVVVSGEIGSGKTRCSMELLRHLYDLAAGGSGTDAFKLMSAALTALRPFDTSAVSNNQESSRSCWSTECRISERAVGSAQITLHSLNGSRLSNRPLHERNYDIFYMLLAGMSHEEKEACCLTAHSIDTLNYLQNTYRKPLNMKKFREKYLYWKDALSMLGVDYLDIMKILSAILLLGNVSFLDGHGSELEVSGSPDLKSAAALLGISGVALYQSLTTRVVQKHKQSIKQYNTKEYANYLCGCLTQSLYSRLVQHINHKINQTMEAKTPHNMYSSINSKTSSPRTPNSSVDSIHIVDSLAFQANQGTQVEQLCGNICAEATQHFYNMHMFNELLDSFDEESITIHGDVRWYDNSATIQLLTEQNIGLVSLLHAESTASNPSCRSLTKKLEKLHSHCDSLRVSRSEQTFTVQHYGGKVTYDCDLLVHENRNTIPDDIVTVFNKSTTKFSLVSKLFSRELKDIEGNGDVSGVEYRCTPCQTKPCETSSASYGEDFLLHMDKLMQTLAGSNSTFVRCIKASTSPAANHWEDDYVKQQIILLELTESLKVITGGLPHRISYKEFVSRYQCLTCKRINPSQSIDFQELSQDIISQFLHIMESKCIPYASANWVFGKKHLYLSDEASRQLEMIKSQIRFEAACKIQATFRGHQIRNSWPTIISRLRSETKHKTHSYTRRGSGYTYDSGYNTPQSHHRITSASAGNLSYEHNLLNTHSDHLFHRKPTFKNMQDMHAPALPGKRNYSVQGPMKVYFPQIRVMRENMNIEGYELNQGQEVLCIGYSSLPSHVSISYQNDILDLPYDKTSIKVCRPGSNKTDTASTRVSSTLTRKAEVEDLNFYDRRASKHLVQSEL